MDEPRPCALFIPELKQLLSHKAYRELREDLVELNPVDLAEGWDAFAPLERILLFKLLPNDRAVALFEELESPDQSLLLGALDPGALGPILEDVDPREAEALFHRLPDRAVRRMMAVVRQESGEGPADARTYPPDTAGALMNRSILSFRPEQTAQQALEQARISVRLHRLGGLYMFYVTDARGRLVGGLSPRTLIAAPRDIKIAHVMGPVQAIKIRADADQEEAARLFAKYKLLAAPVVDEDNRLLGVLSAEDILRVISAEATEDMAKMAGTQAGELETGSLLRVVRLRMPWLLASCGGGVLASLVIHRFEGLLGQVVALAAFMPVISGMGGNVGTQSSTIVVRGLATGHIQAGDVARMAWRELRVGLLLGVSYGLLMGLIAFGRNRATIWRFPAVVGLGMTMSMTVAAVMGALTPMVIRRWKIDPAVCSAPFVSTATDIMSLLAYFSLAAWLLV